MKKISIIKLCFYSTMFGLFAASCSKTETKVQVCNLTQLATASNNSTTSISYNANNHISSLTETQNGSSATYTITTNSSGYVTLISINGSATTSFPLTKSTFAYDQNNNATQVVEYVSGSSAPALTQNFTYNSTNQLIQLQQSYAATGSQGQDSLVYSYSIYTYDNSTTKNPSTITNYNGDSNGKTGDPGVIQLFTYDTQKSVSGGFPGSTNEYNSFATNNVLTSKTTYVFSDGNIEVDQTYTYQYNSNGYPTSKTYKYQGSAVTDTYTYDCK